MFELGAKLSACDRILDYGYDAELQYCYLVGKKGKHQCHCLLYPLETKQERVQDGWAACFTKTKITDEPD